MISQLEGQYLDEATYLAQYGHDQWRQRGNAQPPRYSTAWSSGGPVIEANSIWIKKVGTGIEKWHATVISEEKYAIGYGQTALIAAMRAYVASVYGSSIELEFS